MPTEQSTKPKVKLTGTDGNVFALTGKCVTALRKAGRTPDQVREFTDRIRSSQSYDAALGVMMEYLDVS